MILTISIQAFHLLKKLLRHYVTYNPNQDVSERLKINQSQLPNIVIIDNASAIEYIAILQNFYVIQLIKAD